MRRKRNTFLAVTRTVTEDGRKLLELHKAGKTTAELAEEFHCVQSTIIRALRGLGVKLSRGRPVGAKDRQPRQVKRKAASVTTEADRSSTGQAAAAEAAPAKEALAAAPRETFQAAEAAA